MASSPPSMGRRGAFASCADSTNLAPQFEPKNNNNNKSAHDDDEPCAPDPTSPRLQRRGGISLERTSERKVQIRIGEDRPLVRGEKITLAENTLLEMLDLSENRPRNTGKFLTLNRRRRRVRLRLDDEDDGKSHYDDFFHGQTKMALTQADSWPFNAFALESFTGGRSLPVLLYHLFNRYGLLEYFELDAVRLWKCFNLIEEGYHSDNPYHNAIHASDVSQAMHCFLLEEKIAHNVTPMEIMAALLAAVCHDLDHPGVNQPFLIATSNHLATLYQNSSVLENHHWRSAVACFMESGIFNHFGKIFWDELIWQVRSLILATDITRQQEFLQKFKRDMEAHVLDMTDADYRHFILQIALKCADICNPCRPWDISKTWSDRVCEEFFRQGDFERQLNLPVTSLCDRYTMSKPKIQSGFFRFVVGPLFEAWDGFQQTPMSHRLVKNLKNNLHEWEKLATEEQAAEARAAEEDLNDSLSSESIESQGRETPKLLSSGGTGFNLLRTRRHSMPLNVSKALPSIMARRQSFPRPKTLTGRRALSAEALMPDSRITSISVEASRLAGLFTERRGSRHLVKQMTYPPVRPQPHIHSQSWQEACAELLPGVICPSVLVELSMMDDTEDEEKPPPRNRSGSKMVVFTTPEDGAKDVEQTGKCENGCNTPPGMAETCVVAERFNRGKQLFRLHSDTDLLQSVEDDKENADPDSRRGSLCRQLSDGNDMPKAALLHKSSSQGIYVTGRRGSAPLVSISHGSDDTLRSSVKFNDQQRRGSVPFDAISGIQQRKLSDISCSTSSRRSSLPSTRRESLYADHFGMIPSGSDSDGSNLMLQDLQRFAVGWQHSGNPDPFSICSRLQKRRSSAPVELLSVDTQRKSILTAYNNREVGRTVRRTSAGCGNLDYFTNLIRSHSACRASDESCRLAKKSHDDGPHRFSSIQSLKSLFPNMPANKSLTKQSESFDLGLLQDLEADLCDATEDDDVLLLCSQHRRGSVPLDVRLLPTSDSAR